MPRLFIQSIIIVVSLSNFINACELQSIACGNTFELSLFGNLSTTGRNVILQTDIGAGVNLFRYVNSSITLNIQYRNHSLLTSEFLLLSGGFAFNKHEVRIGNLLGLYTVRLSGYHCVFPCIGGEFVYGYNFTNNVSVKLKQRLITYTEKDNNIFATSTLLGLCISF